MVAVSDAVAEKKESDAVRNPNSTDQDELEEAQHAANEKRFLSTIKNLILKQDAVELHLPPPPGPVT